MEAGGGGLILVIFGHVPGRSEENHEKPQPEQPVSWPRFEPGPPEYEAGTTDHSVAKYQTTKLINFCWKNTSNIFFFPSQPLCSSVTTVRFFVVQLIKLKLLIVRSTKH
jgi:hypothetical protein